MKKRIFLLVLLLLSIISVIIMIINKPCNCDSDLAKCQEIKKIELSANINQIINKYTYDNRLDLFFYNSQNKYSQLNTKSQIKWVDKAANNTNYYIVTAFLYDKDTLLTSQVLRLTLDNDNNIRDFTIVLGNGKQIIDSYIPKKYYQNILTDKCDWQTSKK